MAYVAMVNTEQMHAAAGHLSREWGEDGYTIGIEHAIPLRAVFVCRHRDGSEFRFTVDKWGNVKDEEG